MEENQKVEKVLAISKKKFLVVIIIFAVVLFFLFRIMSGNNLGISQSARMAPPPPPYSSYGNNGTIGDTREFMKVTYSGDVKTHNVPDTMREVRSFIRDSEGRIDSESVSERYGSVRFVIEKNNFEEFRDDMSENFHVKLYQESLTSLNLLSEKQSIEERTKEVQDALALEKTQQAELKKAHSARLASLNTRIGTVQKNLVSVRANLLNTQPLSDEYTSLVQSETGLLSEETSLRSQIQSENNDYVNKNTAFNNKIAEYEDSLKVLANTDQAFIEKIETVEGTVQVRFTSWWGIFKEFSPVHPTIIVIILSLIVFRILQKIRILPIIRFV